MGLSGALVSRASSAVHESAGAAVEGVQEDDMATLTCPSCAASVKPDDLICFTCGANLPRQRARDDDAPVANTVMQEYLRPP